MGRVRYGKRGGGRYSCSQWEIGTFDSAASLLLPVKYHVTERAAHVAAAAVVAGCENNV